MAIRIYSTTNYSLFKKILGNRETVHGHVKSLLESIAEDNMLEYFPIIVNENMEIIDGQHRLEAAKQLGLPIYYEIKHNAGINTVKLANTNMWGWKIADYVEQYIKLGNENYILLQNFCNKYGISISIGMLLMRGNRNSVGDLDKLKKGNFKVSNLKRAEDMAEKIIEMKPYLEKGVWKDREFVIAMFNIIGKVKFEVLLEKLKIAKVRPHSRVLIREYMRDFEDIYNFRLRKIVNFFKD
jgi:hypothetical protein